MTDQYDEEDKPICGCCDEALLNEGCGDIVNRGCCSDGACDKQIEALCGSCGTWDEEDEVWRCPDCQEEHEQQKHNDEPPACETCKKPVWSNNDTWQIIHGCAVCQDCFDENEEAHKPTPLEYGTPRQLDDIYYLQTIWDEDNKKGYLGVLKKNKDGTLERCSSDLVKEIQAKLAKNTK